MVVHLPENQTHDPDRAVTLTSVKTSRVVRTRSVVMNIMCSCGDLLFVEPQIQFSVGDITRAWQAHWNKNKIVEPAPRKGIPIL